MVQSNRKRIAAIELRLKGKSYGEILKALGVSSKGTLAYWFRDLELSLDAKRKLQNKILLARERGLLSFNERRTKSIIQENKHIFLKSTQEIDSIPPKELLLIGASLYWGEGTTREKTRGYQTISFSNSDPPMIKVFMKYLREILKIPENKIKPRVQIHKNIDPEKSKKFWSSVTDLPVAKFSTFNQVSKTSKFKRPINFLPHGTMNIRVHSRQLFYKIKGHIQGIINQLNS